MNSCAYYQAPEMDWYNGEMCMFDAGNNQMWHEQAPAQAYSAYTEWPQENCQEWIGMTWSGSVTDVSLQWSGMDVQRNDAIYAGSSWSMTGQQQICADATRICVDERSGWNNINNDMICGGGGHYVNNTDCSALPCTQACQTSGIAFSMQNNVSNTDCSALPCPQSCQTSAGAFSMQSNARNADCNALPCTQPCHTSGAAFSIQSNVHTSDCSALPCAQPCQTIAVTVSTQINASNALPLNALPLSLRQQRSTKIGEVLLPCPSKHSIPPPPAEAPSFRTGPSTCVATRCDQVMHRGPPCRDEGMLCCEARHAVCQSSPSAEPLHMKKANVVLPHTSAQMIENGCLGSKDAELGPIPPPPAEPPQNNDLLVMPAHDMRILEASTMKARSCRGGGGFRTDTEISATGKDDRGMERKLQSWDDSRDKDLDGTLEQLCSHGGMLRSRERPPLWDQFEANRKQFGIESTFKTDLSQYSTLLDLHRIPDEVKESADRIAREIEGVSRGGVRKSDEDDYDKEDAWGSDREDEEELWSAVPRLALEKEPPRVRARAGAAPMQPLCGRSDVVRCHQRRWDSWRPVRQRAW